MARAGFRKRRYYFTDKSIAIDTVIAFSLGGVALATELAGICVSIATKGHTPEIFAVLYICSFILSIVGFVFAGYGKMAQEGGVRSKRWSHVVCGLAFIIPIAIIVNGLLK